MARIGIRDNGIGIEREGRERLFKPFSQIDSFKAKKYRGEQALGLSCPCEEDCAAPWRIRVV